MDKRKDIEKLIKESFEQQNASAPDNLWAKISGSISGNEEKLLDDKVKESFTSYSEATPAHIWKNINRQLNIDKVWNGIYRELHYKPALYRRIGMAAIFLLLLLAGGGYLFLNSSQEDPALQKFTEKAAENILPGAGAPSKSNRSNDAAGGGKPVLTDKALPEQKASGAKSAEDNAAMSGASDFVAASDAAESNESVAGDLKENKNLLLSDLQLLRLKPLLLSLPSLMLPELHEREVPDAKIPANDKKWEIGIVYSFTNGWILNNDTRKIFKSTSLISAVPSFEHSYGFTAAYNFSEQSAVSADMLVHSAVHQRYNKFEEGQYLDRQIKLNYYKMALLYRYALTRHHPHIQSRYIIKAGFFAGLLKNQELLINNVLILPQYPYTNFDFGIKAALGQERIMQNFIIGYGMAGSYGLKNIFKGDDKISADFNKTNTAGIGAYLSLRYRF